MQAWLDAIGFWFEQQMDRFARWRMCRQLLSSAVELEQIAALRFAAGESLEQTRRYTLAAKELRLCVDRLKAAGQAKSQKS